MAELALFGMFSVSLAVNVWLLKTILGRDAMHDKRVAGLLDILTEPDFEVRKYVAARAEARQERAKLELKKVDKGRSLEPKEEKLPMVGM